MLLAREYKSWVHNILYRMCNTSKCQLSAYKQVFIHGEMQVPTAVFCLRTFETNNIRWGRLKIRQSIPQQHLYNSRQTRQNNYKKMLTIFFYLMTKLSSVIIILDRKIKCRRKWKTSILKTTEFYSNQELLTTVKHQPIYARTFASMSMLQHRPQYAQASSRGYQGRSYTYALVRRKERAVTPLTSATTIRGIITYLHCQVSL